MSYPACSEPERSGQVAVCKALMRQRRMMIDVLGSALCPAPAWDMLLALYLARHEDRKIHLLALCATSYASTGTAHRKIADLVEHGLVERRGDPRDRRFVELRISDKGLGLLDSIFLALR